MRSNPTPAFLDALDPSEASSVPWSLDWTDEPSGVRPTPVPADLEQLAALVARAVPGAVRL